jgi:hypothetical protein
MQIGGGGGDHHHGGVPAFSWRCRVCMTTMKPSQPQALWRRRRPLSNWLLNRQSV